MSALLAEIVPYLVGGLAILAGFLGLRRHYTGKGRDEAFDEVIENQRRAEEKADEASDNVRKMDRNQRRDRLGRWVREDPDERVRDIRANPPDDE